MLDLVCCLCAGPIGNGEPVVVIDGKLAHRFTITCQHCREDRETAESAKARPS